MDRPLDPYAFVVSMSDVAQFKRCRKAFDLSYNRQLRAKGDTSEAMQFGTDFHTIMESHANPHGEVAMPVDHDNLYAVAREYLNNRPLPTPNSIVGAELSLYTALPIFTHARQRVYLRTTVDLFYRRGPILVARDYKTVGQAPNLDPELDFQGRIYTTVIAMHFKGEGNVSFEWEFVRREIGRELKKTGYTLWPVDERYWNVPMVVSTIEMSTTWNELCQAVEDIVEAIERNRFYRTDLRTGPHSCDQCGLRRLCTAEYIHGRLNSADIELLSEPRDDAARLSVRTMVGDPRIDPLTWESLLMSVQGAYGNTGLERVRADDQLRNWYANDKKREPFDKTLLHSLNGELIHA